jgi:uncharacterized metal-binding protein
MRARVRPVLFACGGCAEHGALAPQVAAVLDRRNLAELAPLSAQGAAKAKVRYPIYSLEGCARECARQWLGGHGVRPQRCDMLGDFHGIDAAQLADQIAAGW